MSLKSAPYYWLECDAPECGVKSTELGEFTAWGEIDGALSDAEESEWHLTDDHRHYCVDHANSVCRECGKYDPTELAGERDYLCVECWAKSEDGAA